MANFSMFDHTGELPDSLPFDCDSNYDTYSEMLIYLGVFLYLSVGLISHGYILMSILVTKRKMFLESSFFRLLAVDSVASIIVILNELLFIHLFLFVPPLCSKVGPLFWTYSYTPKFVYLSLNHSRFMKSLAQVFMVVNRMTCVVVTKPGRYDQASISLFQSIAIFFALFFTVICTSITLYNLILLPGRIRSAERSLCFSSIFISITFLLAAGTQVSECVRSQHFQNIFRCYFTYAQLVTSTLFTFSSSLLLTRSQLGELRRGGRVGVEKKKDLILNSKLQNTQKKNSVFFRSAVIMILVNKNLRGPIFQGMKRVSIVSSSS
ncbi:CBN-SRG-15 protein [Caenorhabditis brenneri]|uniref:Serpentine receptor class gamma n=1 Tax=Caenorhabditis brenneri TaxID=135651 RepID=G0PKX6_CAEBE|nr:CBN-SRG-15 protein [Caenorhabditis brenneri]